MKQIIMQWRKLKKREEQSKAKIEAIQRAKINNCAPWSHPESQSPQNNMTPVCLNGCMFEISRYQNKQFVVYSRSKQDETNLNSFWKDLQGIQLCT